MIFCTLEAEVNHGYTYIPSENLQAKSLKMFVEKYHTKINIRTSLSDYRKDDWLTNIPLYMIGDIERIIK